jgi:HipA-like kinase
MPVDARRFIRKMRGGAQAHLIEASDGHFYVVKFVNNPQHRRVLINEWLASTFLRYLGLSCPEVAMVRISEEFVARNPDVNLQLGRQSQAPAVGWHFGSRHPGDPARTTVYDFLPDALLGMVENLGDFAGTLVFDKWMSNADARQAIFFRAKITGEGAGRLGFVAQMVDNGYVFEGPHWRLTDSPLQGLYFRPLVYAHLRGLADFEPWLERIRHFPEEVVDQAVKQIPPAWLDTEGLEGERDEFERLLYRLLERRKRVPDLIEGCRTGRVDPFPGWRK